MRNRFHSHEVLRLGGTLVAGEYFQKLLCAVQAQALMRVRMFFAVMHREVSCGILEAGRDKRVDVQADPHHGERWCQICKNPENAHKPFEALMKLLVVDLETRPDKEV